MRIKFIFLSSSCKPSGLFRIEEKFLTVLFVFLYMSAAGFYMCNLTCLTSGRDFPAFVIIFIQIIHPLSFVVQVMCIFNYVRVLQISFYVIYIPGLVNFGNSGFVRHD